MGRLCMRGDVAGRAAQTLDDVPLRRRRIAAGVDGGFPDQPDPLFKFMQQFWQQLS